MSLRCKPGDIAVIVGGIEQNVGRMVRVIKPCDALHWAMFHADWEVELLQTTRTSSRVGEQDSGPGMVCGCADRILRPIRGGEGQDETLTWAPKGETVPA